MKQVRIRGISEIKDDGDHIVYLGNGTVHRFTNKKQAELFVSNTNKFLTKSLYDLRYIYIDLWKKYQEAWCYLDFTSNQSGAKKSQQNLQLDQFLRQVDNTFDMVIERSSWTNGNHFAFTHLMNCSNWLKQVVLILNQIYRKRSSTFELYMFDTIFDRVSYLENEIRLYGQKRALQIVNVPTHLNEIDIGQPYMPGLKAVS